jgi:hypothetical protein
MQEHQIRVVTEKEELDAKIERLGSFFGTAKFAEVEACERQRLLDQYHVMRRYSEILGERIANFS